LVEEHRHVLQSIFYEMTHCNSDRFRAELDAILAVLLVALGEPDHAAALRILGDCLTEPKGPYDPMEPAERLAHVLPDSALARLAVAAPAAWALDPGAARALLSAPVRASLALPRLLALRRLPPGVAEPVAAHLRARPWLLFASSGVPAALLPV
jgi:hypothetical protein